VFPTEFKRTKYDAIVFSGQSKAVLVKGKAPIPLADPDR
jgi:hypothetical protein